ncbi:DedA family protein [Streptomyces silvisoli]|uniref:Uncharacterized protein n=1 Tax=Streptomyces silvisoli TaxID=3034235 RepID=A0ABT5ZP51_9ACTN|nr:hypothetical protein [Streptomyces silvisoli]MDF3291602.1 hypothetical protein [Streptomyces silvisoli]
MRRSSTTGDYAAVGGMLALEDFGIPVPRATDLMAAAVYAGAGRLTIVAVDVIAVLPAIIEDNIGYVIGGWGGHQSIDRFGLYVLLTPGRVAKAQAFFTRHGGKGITIVRFVGGLRMVNGIIAGLTEMP